MSVKSVKCLNHTVKDQRDEQHGENVDMHLETHEMLHETTDLLHEIIGWLKDLRSLRHVEHNPCGSCLFLASCAFTIVRESFACLREAEKRPRDLHCRAHK